MDLKAVELLTEREFSLDKELRSIGVSNLLSALCGPAPHSVGACLGRSGATGLVTKDGHRAMADSKKVERAVCVPRASEAFSAFFWITKNTDVCFASIVKPRDSGGKTPSPT